MGIVQIPDNLIGNEDQWIRADTFTPAHPRDVLTALGHDTARIGAGEPVSDDTVRLVGPLLTVSQGWETLIGLYSRQPIPGTTLLWEAVATRLEICDAWGRAVALAAIGHVLDGKRDEAEQAIAVPSLVMVDDPLVELVAAGLRDADGYAALKAATTWGEDIKQTSLNQL